MNPGSIGFAAPPAEDDQVRKQRDLARAAREQAAARTLGSSSFDGDLIVQNGGNIIVKPGGDITLEDGSFVAGDIEATTTITAGTDLIAHGGATVDGITDAAGGITSLDIKTRTLSVGYDSVYIDSSNRLGLSPSARRFKQDIQPFEFSPTLIDQIEPVSFRLKGAVEIMGDDAPVEVGFIAEQLDEIGLGKFVTRDSEGTPTGIAYERLTVPLVTAVQQLRSDVARINQALGLSQEN